MTKSRINEIIHEKRPKSGKPISVQFQNGDLIEGLSPQLDCGNYIDDEKNFKPIIASESLLYTGNVDETDEIFNTFILIRNKKTNKMRLVSIDEAMLKPQTTNREIIDSTMMEVNKKAMSELNKQFGSKKTKRHTEQLEKLQINVENVRDQLERTVSNVEIGDIPGENDGQIPDYIPPINETAENLDEIYVLEKLIPSEVLKSVKGTASTLLEQQEFDTDFKEYLKKSIVRISKYNISDKEKEAKACLVLVLDALLNIYAVKAKDIGVKTYQCSKYSRALSDFVIENFTVSTGKSRTRPLSMKDKTVLYVLVFASLTESYNLDLNEMNELVKVSLKKLQEFCRILRMNVKGNKATLVLPLPSKPVRPSPKKARR